MARKVLAMFLAFSLVLGCAGALAESSAEGEWWNILLLGSDDRDMSQKSGRTDTVIILSVNQEKSQAKLTSIMRDTWVSIPGRSNGKINAANVYGGPELAVETVNENFGTDIENYILVNMEDVIKIIDLFGGIDIEISESEKKWTNQYASDYLKYSTNYEAYSLDTSLSESGLVHMTGLLAMSFCRDRYTDSDFGRVMRAQKVLLALAEKAQNMELDETLEIASQVQGIVSTNMTDEQIVTLATAVLTIEPETVEQNRIPADGAYQSGTFSGTWMIRPDLEKNTELLHQYIYGE